MGPFMGSRFGPEALVRLRGVFEGSRHPMLIADDQRRGVSANAAACELLRTAQTDVPWQTVEDFTPASERREHRVLWEALLKTGAAEGWYQLDVPDRGALAVEFSATANILPGRHLLVFVAPESAGGEPGDSLPGEAAWRPVPLEISASQQLTAREREVMTLVAAGLQTRELADRLFLSPETVKSHASNAMVKLGSTTRAHAVAIALVTGQIPWGR